MKTITKRSSTSKKTAPATKTQTVKGKATSSLKDRSSSSTKATLAKKTQTAKRTTSSSAAKRAATSSPKVPQQKNDAVNPLFHLIEPHLGVVHGPKNLSTMKL